MHFYSLVSVFAFVILTDEVTNTEEAIKEDLKQLIRNQIGSFAVPQGFLVCCRQMTNCNFNSVSLIMVMYCRSVVHQITPGLPKTRSGKIMRRILCKIAANDVKDLGDVSTLADPSVVELLLNKHRKGGK